MRAGTGVSVARPAIGKGLKLPVGVQGTGWKGVGVAVAFGAAVTKTKGRGGCAWADVILPQPESRMLTSNMIRIKFLIYSGAGLTGVGGTSDGVNVGGTLVAVGGTSVAVGGTSVAVGTIISVGVKVGKSGMTVTPGLGVRVGTFGTQSSWPE